MNNAGMNNERAELRARRDISRDRVRRMTLAAGATAAVTGGVLAVGLAGPSQHVTSSGTSATQATPVDDRSGSDDTSYDDGTSASTQTTAPAPAAAQGSGSVTRSGGS